ncbi:hypothetical protein [Methylorubrum sp. Q1]|uniref:hypothetical protein n=1 Tax=Methylorubrum sp. Q1 TaxID=2562453 RepID=UPI001FE08B6F|nr:hypothetical protein [Methylorubrum sp. Q1]
MSHGARVRAAGARQLGPGADPDAARVERVIERLRAVSAPTPEAACARLVAAVSARQAHRAAASAALVARSADPGDALPAGAARAEVYRGEESAARQVIEIAGPIVTQSGSWVDLHKDLAEHGIAYAAKGSGAVFVVDGIVLKASTCRAASRAKLEARLGPFQPSLGGDEPPLKPDRRPPRTTPSPRAAPGIDPALFTLARQAEITAHLEREAYDALYPDLNVAPLLKAAVVGPPPRAAPSARTLAGRIGKPLPRLVPVREPGRSGSNLSGLLALYHAGLQAERYRVVAECAGSRETDRLVQLTPRSMAGIAAGWAALERAAGRDSAVYLTPISNERHHLVLSGLRIEEVGQLQATGFAPALVLDRRDGRHEVVLTAQNRNRPYEQAALAEASEHIRFSLALGRRRFGLRIAAADPPETAASDSGASRQRIYAQVLTATGAICERLGRLISRCIAVFERRFGRGPSSRLGRGLDPDGVPAHADAPLYWGHRADLLARWQGRWPDPSRVDALIARRLRGTGHSEPAVAALITACAPAVPRIGRYAWQSYGQRAAANAFRTDTDDGAWVFDRTSSAMWGELEQAVKKRAEDQIPKTITVPRPPPPPLPEPARQPREDKIGLGTTRRNGRRGRGDPDGPGDR